MLTVTGATTEHRGAREQTAAATAVGLLLALDVVEILFLPDPETHNKEIVGKEKKEWREKLKLYAEVEFSAQGYDDTHQNETPSPLPAPRSWRSLPGADDTSLRLHAHTRTINKIYNHGNASKMAVTSLFLKDAGRRR